VRISLLPTIGQVITLEVTSEEQDKKQILKSRIADENKQLYWIEAPSGEKGRFFRLVEGDMLIISYTASANGVTYSFKSEVKGNKKENSADLFAIKKPAASEVVSVQRRAFVRVKASLEVACLFAGVKKFVATTNDISGGGLSMITEPTINLQAEDELECWLLVPFRNGTIEHIPFIGAVVRTKEVDDGLLVMMRFVEISESDRQKIVRYVFERQIELRK